MHNHSHYAAKIVATLGPATDSLEMLEQIIHSGVNVVRLNFSHGSVEMHQQRARLVREASQIVGREVAIMADLQGPKIRVGKFINDKVQLVVGRSFLLDTQPSQLGDETTVGVEYKELPQDVKLEDILLLNDGLIVLQVTEINQTSVLTKVIVGGELANNKGINKQGGGLSAAALTSKDKQDIKLAIALEVDYVAVSFPKSAADLILARQLIDSACKETKQHRPGVVAKIERTEAIANLEEIILASDAVMVARGDLAVEIGNPAVPAVQKHIIKLARKHNRAVITATQMMESMINNPVPTRAEVSDVANAVLDGTDAVMLSGESAVGKYPLETVQQMKRICCACEESNFEKEQLNYADYQINSIDQSIALAAQLAADKLAVKAMVVLTTSGTSALWLSRMPVHMPIYALTPNLAIQRKMALYRNVRPILVDTDDDTDAAIELAEQELKSLGIVSRGDLYAITCGKTMGTPGGTNMLMLKQVL